MRDRLVEIVKRAAYSCLPSNTEDFHLDRFVTYLLANGVTVQEWVSVEDRLPEVGRDVLFVCENKSYGAGAYSNTYRDFFSGQFPVKGVTHWMPLPQPPKGE